MDPQLSQLRVFCLSVELGSFTRAARAAGLTPQAVSRSVARLEESLGQALFRRSTRQVEPTEAGRLFYAASAAALERLDEAQAVLALRQEQPVGEVRVSVPTTYGHHRFLPMLAEFCALYPQVEVDLEISNRNVDFVREGFDLAVRMGELGDAAFVARRLGDFSVGVFASPAYLAERGAPRRVEDIAQHRCAVFVMPSSGRLLPWGFTPPGPASYLPPATLRVRHDVLGLIHFARAGGGLVQIYHFLVEAELARGELVELLPELAGRSRPFSLIYPKQAVSRPAVRALVDFVVARARADRAAGSAAQSPPAQAESAATPSAQEITGR
ncbi:MAG: LysR family transcriptional regulator [Alphaproteobacteria bacterium]|nr:LysR family transcriptional regulator [Alphaproteobacteria bacterium]